MSQFYNLWPYLLPIVLLQLALLTAALLDLWRRPRTRGPRWVWLIVIVGVNLIGPLVYFIWGREE